MLNSELKFHWTAQFEDGSEISQYDENGNEHLYKEVLESSSKLISFYIVHIVKPLKITVDVTRGILFINGKQEPSCVEELEIKHNIRVIFFRRTKGTVNLITEQIQKTMTYFIGYQYNNVHGANYQIVLQVDEEGNILI